MPFEIQLTIFAVVGVIRVIMLNFGMLLSKVQPDLFNIHVVFHLLDVLPEIENFGLSLLQLSLLCLLLVAPVKPTHRPTSLTIAA